MAPNHVMNPGRGEIQTRACPLSWVETPNMIAWQAWGSQDPQIN